MNYSKDEFLALVSYVEDQGGVLLDELCASHQYLIEHERRVSVTLPGCGNISTFEVPYESMMAGVNDATVRVCAVDDSMGRWPRFGGDRFAKERTTSSPSK